MQQSSSKFDVLILVKVDLLPNPDVFVSSHLKLLTKSIIALNAMAAGVQQTR